MISDIFIDRPRLSIVISVVITIAGLIAITQIPVAQFPDIVPPQVQVTTSYPGASAAVVESTVGQPIESKVNGVENMLYMKSSSANDGSYTLNVSFALGTDPDINTVNVQNRVNQATAQLPEEVSRQGLTVKNYHGDIPWALGGYLKMDDFAQYAQFEIDAAAVNRNPPRPRPARRHGPGTRPTSR